MADRNSFSCSSCPCKLNNLLSTQSQKKVTLVSKHVCSASWCHSEPNALSASDKSKILSENSKGGVPTIFLTAKGCNRTPKNTWCDGRSRHSGEVLKPLMKILGKEYCWLLRLTLIWSPSLKLKIISIIPFGMICSLWLGKERSTCQKEWITFFKCAAVGMEKPLFNFPIEKIFWVPLLVPVHL